MNSLGARLSAADGIFAHAWSAQVQFDSDEKVAKQKARFMIRMVDSLNQMVLAAIPGRSEPPVTVQCVTCHRGLSKPTTLEATLMKTINDSGVDSAIKQYRGLRERIAVNGYYDFTEWRINELARHLVAAGKKAKRRPCSR